MLASIAIILLKYIKYARVAEFWHMHWTKDPGFEGSSPSVGTNRDRSKSVFARWIEIQRNRQPSQLVKTNAVTPI